MQLLSLKLHNIFCYKDVELSFNDMSSGTVLVCGQKDGDMKASNYSGKTSLFEAITWALYGQVYKAKGEIRSGTTRALKVLRSGSKQGWAVLSFMIDNHKVVVKRSCSGTVKISEGDKEHSFSRVTKANEYIEKNIIRMSFDAWINSIMFSGERFANFLSLSSSQRKQVLEEAIRVEILRKAGDIVGKKLKSEAIKLDDIDKRKQNISGRITTYKKLIGEYGVKDFQGERERIINEIAKLECDSRKNKKEYRRVEKKLYSLDNEKALLGAHRKGGYAEKKVKEGFASLVSKNPAMCPICGHDAGRKLPDMILSFMDRLCALCFGPSDVGKIEILNKKQEAVERVFTKLEENERAFTDKIYSLHERLKDFDKLLSLIKAKDDYKKNLRSLSIGYRKQAILCDEVLRPSVRVLGVDGAVNVALEAICGSILNTRPNEYLAQIDCPFRVKFVLDNKLHIFVVRGKEEADIRSLSTSEKVILSIAISLALGDIFITYSRPVNFIVYDEPFICVDIKNSEKIMDLFKGIAREWGILVFIISNRFDIISIHKNSPCVFVDNNNGISDVSYLNRVPVNN